MTPICYCKAPLVVVTKHPATPYHAAYTTSHCERCRLTHSVKHGSTPATPTATEARDA